MRANYGNLDPVVTVSRSPHRVLMSDDDAFIYGPFLDEELFFYEDVRRVLELDAVQIFDMDLGCHVGLDDLEKIHDQGRGGSFDTVMFSGVATLRKTSWLCERGFKMLLREVERRHPNMNADKLHRYCKQGHVKVELHCQLALMPVCYLTKSPANSILIYSKNLNNLNAQRRYIVNTFQIGCFRRSELTLQRYILLKFIIDACTRYRNDVPREERDVHWLAKVYLEDYNAIFKNRQRPRLHRSEVYDHFATHSKWLRKVLRQKQLLDRALWEEWMDESALLKNKARRKKLKWGAQLKRQVVPQDDPVERDDYVASDDNVDDVSRSMIPGTDSDSSSSQDPDPESSSCSSSDNDDGQVQYSLPRSLRSRAHRGLFKAMPLPTWYWTCNITDDCPFTIDLGSKDKRDADAPCMELLTPKEKAYLRDTVWGLYDKRLGRIWRKMCQAHMDWHWREAGLVLDHARKRIYGVEEETEMQIPEDA